KKSVFEPFQEGKLDRQRIDVEVHDVVDRRERQRTSRRARTKRADLVEQRPVDNPERRRDALELQTPIVLVLADGWHQRRVAVGEGRLQQKRPVESATRLLQASGAGGDT